MRDFYQKRVKVNKEIVKSWPKWMQRYVITAEAFKSGKLIKKREEK